MEQTGCLRPEGDSPLSVVMTNSHGSYIIFDGLGNNGRWANLEKGIPPQNPELSPFYLKTDYSRTNCKPIAPYAHRSG